MTSIATQLVFWFRHHLWRGSHCCKSMAGQDGSNAGTAFVGTLPFNVMYIRYFSTCMTHELGTVTGKYVGYRYMNLWLAGLALALGRLRSSLNLTALFFHANSRGLTGSREAWRHPEVWDCQVPGRRIRTLAAPRRPLVARECWGAPLAAKVSEEEEEEEEADDGRW